MKTIQKLLLAVILLGGWSGSSNAATTAEYEAQIKALLNIITNLHAQAVCLEENLAMFVGDEQARMMRDNCGVPVVIAAGLTVSAPVQPPASLAPLGAARIPFTKITFTAGAQDETVNGISVQREGLSVDAVLDSIMLLDENGMQIGSQKFLNSEHQARLTSPFTVKAGQSRTFTIAANRSGVSNAAHAGMTVGLSLVGVNTSATVTGPLPIIGPLHVVNEGLMIGSVVAQRGSTDPGASSYQYVGTSHYTFSAIRITAGSAEDEWFGGIRWYQSGSELPENLANIQTRVDGVLFATSVSEDGRYYTSMFGGKGILIKKGFSVEVAIKGDIIGGYGRTIDFDLERRSDLYLVGATYGFGITPPFGSSLAPVDSSSFSFTDNPWYDAAEVVVASGDITIDVSALVPSQNVTVNTVYQPLGGFTATVRGEPISIDRLGFNVALGNEGTADDVDDLTNIIVVDENGSIVAGPVDGSAVDDSRYTAGSADGSVIFTDTVTFPIGTHSYKIIGKVGSDLDYNSTIQLSTTPATDFALVRGLMTGATITPSPSATVTLNAMTVKRAALTLSAFELKDHAVLNGARSTVGFVIRMDTTTSGEGIRALGIPLVLTVAGGARATDITRVQLFNEDNKPINTGSNVKNPTSDGEMLVTFDGTGLIQSAGVIKHLTLRFDLSLSAVGTFQWSLPTDLTAMSVVGGLSSATAVLPVVGWREGPVLQAVTHGVVQAQFDPSTPITATVDTTNALVLRFNTATAHEKFSAREVVFESQVLKGDSWVPLAEYQAELFVGNVKRAETIAMPYPNFEQMTAGRLNFFIDRELAVSEDAPFELRVDTTGFPTGTKARFTLIEVKGVGYDSGANYSAVMEGTVMSEVLIVGPEAVIKSLKVLKSGGINNPPLVVHVEIEARGLPNQDYLLEHSYSLLPGSWSRIPGILVATRTDAEGNLRVRFESVQLGQLHHEFYRFVLVP